MLARGLACSRTASTCLTRPARLCRTRRAFWTTKASKGFSADSAEASTTNQEPAAPEASASSSIQEADELSIEARIRSRRKRVAAAPKVKVVNATLEAAKAAEGSPESQADAAFVSILALVFVVIIIEGLIVAGSGFLSDDLDQIVQDVVYPAFTPTVGVFVACSAFYGLWKTGRLPGQKQL